MDLIGNRYQLHEQLGEGGMGVVYRATDRLTGQTVALKRVLVSSLSGADSASSKFRLSLAREFQTLASLRHPNIITVIDYGFDTGQHPYFTMSLLEKAQNIREAAAGLSTKGKVNLLIQLLQALAYLHRRGILHRDLKPGNVLVEGKEHVRVLDFGLAVAQLQATTTDGTVTYMAPEVISSKKASKVADLYSVGVMAYEMFAGCYPFDTSDMRQLLSSIFYDNPDLSKINTSDIQKPDGNPSALGNPKEDTTDADTEIVVEWSTDNQALAAAPPSSTAPDLVSIIGRLMAKDPNTRYQDAYDVIADLSVAIGEPFYEESAAIRESFLEAATFIGRDKELAQLTAAMREAMEGRGSAWIIGGESGVGKSRLVDELRTQVIVEGVTVLRGQNVHTGSLPYQAWIEPLRRLILSTELSDIEASILKEVIPDIDKLLGRKIPDAPTMESKARQQRLILTIITLFRRQKQPVVLLMEDLHWAGISMIPLQRLIQFVGQLPLLIVGNYRSDENPNLPDELPGSNHIKLKRLTDENIVELSVSMLGKAGNQQQILDFLRRETEGNVFFMVETVRALAEEAGRLTDIANMQLPAKVFAGGVQRILQRRLERVPQDYRPLLKVAAIAGRSLDINVLNTVEHQVDLDTWLSICANVAVFDRQDEQWRFAHEKLRETLVNEMAAQERQQLHLQVAESIEKVYPNDRSRAALLMDHWHHAQNTKKEAHYARIAGEQTMLISNFHEAIKLFNRALDLIPAEQTEVRAGVVIKLGMTHESLSDYNTATRYLKEGLELTQKSNNQLMTVEALNGLGWVAEQQGSYEEAQELASKALTIARDINDEAGTAKALKNLGNIFRLRGEYEEAQKNYKESLDIRTRLDDQEGMAVCLNNLGLIAYSQGDLESATRYMTQALEIMKKLGARMRIAGGLSNLGVITASWGDSDIAKKHFEESLLIRREIGDRAGIASTLDNLGMLAKEQQDYAEAHRYFEESLLIRREIGERRGVTNSLINLGAVSVAQDKTDEAETYFREALTEAQNLEALTLVLEILVEFAGLRVRTGDHERAAELLGVALYHPSLDTAVQMATKPILTTLGEKLSPEALNPCLERGKTLELNGVIKDLLKT
jgi:serine/threonine protein kinase/tetratricopeptide (TPR) repeat protein